MVPALLMLYFTIAIVLEIYITTCLYFIEPVEKTASVKSLIALQDAWKQLCFSLLNKKLNVENNLHVILLQTYHNSTS